MKTFIRHLGDPLTFHLVLSPGHISMFVTKASAGLCVTAN